MARQANTLFLEEWLRTSSGSIINTSADQSSLPSARAIIQAWSELRDCHQHQSFEPHHFQALKILLDARASLHVADPQAKLLVSILSSTNLVIPHEAYPLLFRLLYIWVRKSFRPSSALIDLAVETLSHLLATELGSKKSPEFFSEGVLLLGAFSFVPSVSESSKTACLELLCRLLEDEYRMVSQFGGLIPDVLAGIGYALCSSVIVFYARTLNALLGIWGKEDGPPGSETLGTSKKDHVPFAVVMAAAGVLRALNRSAPSRQGLQILSSIRISAENRIESVAQCFISKSRDFENSGGDYATSLLLQCISLAVARSGSVSSRPALLLSLASALLTEIFPLRRLYARILESTHGSSGGLEPGKIKEHLSSVTFREAGAISSVFCNQYISVDDENKMIVENMIWRFCQELYSGHRKVAFLLHGKADELLEDVEKIAESAFLMVVVFALAVTKQRLNSKFSTESQMETSVLILVSFSCLEYFRRMRLSEYMDTIRGVVVSAQENETACISFVESMPTYGDLTNPQEFQQKVDYMWFKDEVQTARILFYLRVIPTCIERLPGSVFSRVVAPTMFLYMGHPNGKVARASHSLFAAFISSGKDSNENERSLLKEQLVFFYMQRSLAGFPGITPFEGMASGVAALVRNLPAGSPATFYCIHSLVEKASKLCTDIATQKPEMWKNWEGESEPCKKILELLLRLISLVDIQVLPDLMKLLAKLFVELPKEGQNVVLNKLYAQVAESDDVTRKPALVSWLQSVSYLCYQSTSGSAPLKGTGGEGSLASSLRDPSNWDGINARL
ncbi:hypothetical protein OIU85_006862 [Salix viminalis]|uniref:Uncharacterized protein n=1 Tax=Salix viminalis TaxID=40686 RepID=A0A9Q0PLT6_SALVM|nr:hypothetical protein OIU85_006862 [Salix viminalis]